MLSRDNIPEIPLYAIGAIASIADFVWWRFLTVHAEGPDGDDAAILVWGALREDMQYTFTCALIHEARGKD